MLKQAILHADETPVTIMKHHGNSPKQGYVWAYITPQHINTPDGFKAVVYDFAESRRNEHPNTFLHGFKGKLICDDYNGYKQLFNKHGVTEIGCMAHARRKFFDLHQQKTSLIAHEALDYIGQLYGIERQIDALFEKAEESQKNLENSGNLAKPPIQPSRLRDFEAVRKIRQAKAKPIADKLYEWLQQRRQQVEKNYPITKALDYCLKRWTALTRYLEDGRLPIDNNWAENQMRPWALGRKNWLFAGSLRSGQRAAVIMSLIQSARLNGLDVYAYLSDVLKRLPTHKDKDIDELLPHLWKIQ